MLVVITTGCGFGMGAGTSVAKGSKSQMAGDTDVTVRTDNIDFLFSYRYKSAEIIGTTSFGNLDVRTRGLGIGPSEDSARFSYGIGGTYRLFSLVRAFAALTFDALGAVETYQLSRTVDVGLELRQDTVTGLFVRAGVHLDSLEIEGSDSLTATGMVMSIGVQSYILDDVFKRRR